MPTTTEIAKQRTFLRRMSHVFPANVENVLLAARVNTAQEMLSILRNMDEALARRHERQPQMPHHRRRSGSSGVDRDDVVQPPSPTPTPRAACIATVNREREGGSSLPQWREKRYVNVQHKRSASVLEDSGQWHLDDSNDAGRRLASTGAGNCYSSIKRLR